MAMAKGVGRMPGGPDWLHLKGRAELRSDEEGYTGAWFEVVIGRLFPASKQAWVEYIHFEDEETGAAHEEFVRVDNLRPLPPVLPSRKWKERDSVETYYNNAWWVGYIKGRVARDPDKYLVYYGKGEQDLEIHAHHIRPRQNYLRPSRDCPNGSWSVARPMQNPAIWERIEETPVAKTPIAKTPVAKMPVAKTPVAKTPVAKTPVAKLGTKRPDVGKIQPRVSAPVSDGDESDDSWDAQEERRQKKRPRVHSKSKNAPAKSQVEPKRTKIRFVSHAKALNITQALPAINPPAKVAEQSTLVLTPGSSPPLVDSPFQDSAISPGSVSQAQKPLANSEASPPTRSSSSNSSSSRGSGSSNSSSSGEDDDDCVQISGNGDHSEEEDVSIGGRMSHGIFPDFSNDGTSRNKKVYQQLLVCFKHDSKGMLDSQRHNILTAIRMELKLSTKDVNGAHCLVFGLPLPMTEM